MTQWWDKPFRIFQTNIREIDAVMDVEKVLDDLESFHANAWLINTGGIVSFYPSKLPYQHPSPWLAERASGDLIGDVVEAAHKRGVKVISRFDWSKLHHDVYDQHPEWFFVNKQGKPQIYNDLYSACPNGFYNQQLSFEVMAEVLDQYAIDGVFFNMFGFASTDYSGNYHGVCHCENCQRKFRNQYGRELPEKEDWTNPGWPDYVEFSKQTSHELSSRMRDFINQKRPDVGLFLFMHAGMGNVIMHEINNKINRPLPYWSYNTGEKVKLSQAEYPGKPVTTNSVLFLDIPYRFANEQPEYVGLRIAQMLAHGSNPYVYVIGTTEQPDRRNHAKVREMLGIHEKQADYSANLRPVSRVALVQPSRSESLHPGYKSGEPFTAAFRGLYRVLTESHVQFDVFYDRSLVSKAEKGELAQYDLLVLPNAACLADNEGQVIDTFVQNGGHVVATFETGLYDQQGKRREQPLLECLGYRQITFRREEMRSAVLRIRPEDRSFLPGLEDTDLISILGEFLYGEVREGSQSSFTMIPPMRYGPPEKVYWDHETDVPGLIWQNYGKGRTAYIPFQPDRYYYDLCLPEYRDLLAGIVRELAPRPVVLETNAAPSVELVVRDQDTGKGSPARRMVSLVNYSGQNGRSFFEPVEMRDIKVTVAVDCPVNHVRALMLAQDLPFEAQEGQIGFTLPRLGLYEKVVLEPER